jgi:hypothetical protein
MTRRVRREMGEASVTRYGWTDCCFFLILSVFFGCEKYM